jgi:hypothetical protein
MMFWLVLKLEIRLVIIELYYLEGFWFSCRGFLEDYIIFVMVKYLSFHNSSFALRYFLM